jgi:phage-related protein
VKREAGHQLMPVQKGVDPDNCKPMPSIGSGVREIKIQYESAFRIVYIAKFEDDVYVLHAFQKKTQKTTKKDLDLSKSRLK